MSVESFLGFKKELIRNKETNKEPSEVFRLLFLIVFACAYTYFPTNSTFSNSGKTRAVKSRLMSKAHVDFLSTSRRKLKSNRPLILRKEVQKKHYFDEPLCQLVKTERPTKIKARRAARISEPNHFPRSPSCVRRSAFTKRMADVKKNEIVLIKESMLEDVNPNPNEDPPISIFSEVPVKQVKLNEDNDELEIVNPNGAMNPNSRDRLKKKPMSDPAAGDEKNECDSVVVVYEEILDQGEKEVKSIVSLQEKFVHQQQQESEKKIKLLERKNDLLKTSILDSQERVAQIRVENEILKACVTEKDDQLQQKDDLILGLQMQMMNYEAISGSTPNGDVDMEARVKQEQKDEMSSMKRIWLDCKLEYEKRINKLINAVVLEKERVKFLQSKASGREGRLESERSLSDISGDDPGHILKNSVGYMGSYVSSQQMQIEPSGSPSARNMLDLMLDVESEVGNSVSELEIIKERNRELDFQVCQSDKAIGELEFMKTQLIMNLDQEPGKEVISISNIQTQMAEPGQRAEEIPTRAPQPRKSKLFKLLSCRRADIDHSVSKCEMPKRVITQVPELRQL